MYPSKRSSVSSSKHHNSVASIDIEPNLECQRIERYMEYIKQSLRTHLKEKLLTYEETELKELHKLIKAIQMHYSKMQKQNQQSIRALKEQLEREKHQKEEIIRKIKSESDENIAQIQREMSQKMLSINNQFGRKQQKYKEIIEKLVNSLNVAKRMHQNGQNKLESATRTLQKLVNNQRNNHNAARSIKDIVEEIQLRQQNSKISSKSDEMSIDEIVISGKRLGINLLEENSEHFQQPGYTPIQKRIEQWLIRLICHGLFMKENQQCIKKMITFTVNYEHPGQIVKENIFPLISQILINNMKNHHESAVRYLQGSSYILQMNEEQSRVQLRNVTNLSQLSINDSQIQQMNFRKKDHP